jgi:hypothetical protein
VEGRIRQTAGSRWKVPPDRLLASWWEEGPARILTTAGREQLVAMEIVAREIIGSIILYI